MQDDSSTTAAPTKPPKPDPVAAKTAPATSRPQAATDKGSSSPGSEPGVEATTQPGSDAEQEARGAAAKAMRAVEKQALHLRDKAGDQARSAADQGKHRASEAITNLGKLLDDSADAIDKNIGENYGGYARDAARTVTQFASRLDEREVDELLEDARGFVRKSPAVAIGAAAAIGFVVARLIKAGLDPDRPEETDKDDIGQA